MQSLASIFYRFPYGISVQPPRRSDQLWLHETTQRLLVRLAIVMLALLPLMGTVAFVAVSRTDWYRLRQSAFWRTRILNNTGLDAVFASIDMPSPNRFVIRELVFSDPETKSLILWADKVVGEMTSSGWAVAIDGAQIKPEKTDLALKILHDQLLCRPHNSVPILKLTVGNLQMMLNSATEPSVSKLDALQDILVEYSPSHSVSEIKLRYSVASAAQQIPSLVHVVRNHDAKNPRTEWAIDTKDGALPCSVLARYFPVLAKVGNVAQFTGQVRWLQDSKGWECQIENGRFDHCSWDHLSQDIGSPMQGHGSMLVSKANLRNGVLENAQGSFNGDEAYETTVDLAWLRESVRAFGWDSDNLSELKTPSVKVSGLNLAFQLNHKGIQWMGQGAEILYQQQPAYQQFATIDGLRLVTRIQSHETATSTVSLGQWLARSASGEYTNKSLHDSKLPTDSGDPSNLSRWQSQLATLLPPPAPSAGPIGRVSVVPTN